MINLDQIKEVLEKAEKYYVVFVGDSITSCEWVHPNWRDIVIYVLQNEMNDRVENWRTASWGIRGFNFGYDGATTRDIVNKLPEILAIKPNLVIGLMGGNDHIMDVSVDESGNNIEKIVDEGMKIGANVIWCTSIPSLDNKKNAQYEPYTNRVMEVAGKGGLLKINLFLEYKKYPMDRFFTFLSEEIPEENIKEGDLDTIHPNQLGNAYIAKIVLKEVFGIDFDPEKYIADTLGGEKYPGYK